LHFQLKDDKAALDDLTKAIQIDPGIAIAYRNRADVYQDMHQAAAAKADLQTADRLEPLNK
jgi:Tfp pilus assembly protein PilF